ncbi:hypothetical protein [Brachybacterium hainanense]|uniref:Ig-like domain-containing protein n=1 Tax=Brachybacterium hainanense TaxID=1541174 RepID=A0ABV6RFT9_9MICO
MNSMRKISRRSLAKGIAWTAPAMTMAIAAPAIASSTDPTVPADPAFDFAHGVKNPGNSCTNKACMPKDSYATPVTITNPTAHPFIVEFLDYRLGVTSSSGTDGASDGVSSVGRTYSAGAQLSCSTGSVPACSPLPCQNAGGTTVNASRSVCIQPGQTLSFWVITGGLSGNSSNVPQYVSWRWIDATDCTVKNVGSAYSPDSSPNSAC